MNTDKLSRLKDFLELLGSYNDLYGLDVNLDIRWKVTSLIEKLELENEFGFDLGYNTSESKFYKLSEYQTLNYMDGVRRTISMPDDDDQPQGEYLYVITFACGPYTLHSAYPEDTFNNMFKEFKSFGPKYVDSMNKSLYFDSSKAKVVHEAFWDIFKKYKALVDKELITKQIAKLQQDLSKIKGD